jgi:hypothetical protein
MVINNPLLSFAFALYSLTCARVSLSHASSLLVMIDLICLRDFKDKKRKKNLFQRRKETRSLIKREMKSTKYSRGTVAQM